LNAPLLLTKLVPLAVCASALASQAQVVPVFEVVSVKPNASGAETTASYVLPGGRYTAMNVTLRMLMKTAYQIHDTQIVDGPGWIDVDRFDVSAKAADARSCGMNGARFRSTASSWRGAGRIRTAVQADGCEQLQWAGDRDSAGGRRG